MGGRWLVVLVLAAAVGALGGCGGGERLAEAREIPGAPAAPGFELRDAEGHLVKLSDFRGRPVLLTFLFTTCPDVCPLTVGKLRAGLDDLGAKARDTHVVAVSVDPAGDTPRAVRRFVRRHHMEGRMTYLIGSRSELAPVWRAYGISVKGGPEDRAVGHGSWTYGIDGKGRRQLLYGQDFKAAEIAHDVPLLASR